MVVSSCCKNSKFQIEKKKKIFKISFFLKKINCILISVNRKSILVAHNNYLLGLEHLNQIPSYSRTTNNTDDVLRQFDSLDSNKYVINKKRNSKLTFKLSLVQYRSCMWHESYLV